MKKIAIITVLFVLLSFASCGPVNSKPGSGEHKKSPVSETESQSAYAPPMIAISIDGSIDPENATIDPVYEDGKINSILSLCFEGLFRFGEDANGNAVTELCLAESYKVEGNKVYSFTLKPGVTFRDDSDVTAEDWLWSFERLKNTPESPWLAYADLIESITSPSANQLIITLNEPRADFESLLALPCFAVQSKKHFEEIGAEKYVTSPMGTGAYYIEDWKIRDHYFLRSRYFLSTSAHAGIYSVDFRVINDPELRYGHMATGCISPPQDKLSELSEDYYLELFPSAEQRYICFNVTKAPFDNPQVRRALRMATDKDEIIAEALLGQGEKAHNVFMDSSLYFNGDIKDDGFDIDRAQALLAEAGYPEGFSCEMSYNSENETAMKLAQILSGQWARIGVELELNALDPTDLNARLSDLSYDVATMRWADETNDPAAFAGFIASYDISKGFYTGYNNLDLSYLTAAAIGADDAAERENCYRQFQQILYDDCPMFPIYKEATSVVMNKHVTGFKITKLGYFNFDNLRYN